MTRQKKKSIEQTPDMSGVSAESSEFREQLCSLLLESMGGDQSAAERNPEHHALTLVREFMARTEAAVSTASTPKSVPVAGSSPPQRKRKKPINPLFLDEPERKSISRFLLADPPRD